MIIRALAVAALACFLGGCLSPAREGAPVRTGTGTNDLKKSPCACIELRGRPLSPAQWRGALGTPTG